MTILGEGGIGKSSLIIRLCVELVEDGKNKNPSHDFGYIYWKNLRSKLDFAKVLDDIIEFIAGDVEIPDSVEGKIELLISIFKISPCLIVLDNAETIQSRRRSEYEEGYEKFGLFLKEVATNNHYSRLIITSREAFQEISSDNPDIAKPPKTIKINGLNAEGTKEIFNSKKRQSQFNQNFSASDEAKDWEVITAHYGGNPFILYQVAAFILENYSGDLSKFRKELEEGKYPCSEVDEVLDRQFERLGIELIL